MGRINPSRALRLLVDSSLLVAYEEETSFPCKICGALYYSGAQQERHIATYHPNKGRYCKHCQKEFRKDNNKLLHERCYTGTYHNSKN